MAPAPRDLSYRTRGRREITLGAFLRVQDADAAKVRYARAALTAQGEIAGTTVDLSEGGVGIITDTYIPRWCRVWIRVPSPIEGRPPLLAISGQVHRCTMCDRRPAYLIGIGFRDLNDTELTTLRSLLGEVEACADTQESPC